MYIRSVAAIPLVNTSTEERVNKHCEAQGHMFLTFS